MSLKNDYLQYYLFRNNLIVISTKQMLNLMFNIIETVEKSN